MTHPEHDVDPGSGSVGKFFLGALLGVPAGLAAVAVLGFLASLTDSIALLFVLLLIALAVLLWGVIKCKDIPFRLGLITGSAVIVLIAVGCAGILLSVSASL